MKTIFSISLIIATFWVHAQTALENNPHKRAHHAMVYDESSNTVLMTCGSTPLDGGQSSKVFNDLWHYNGVRWTTSGTAGVEQSGIRLAYHAKQKKVYSYGGFLADGKGNGQLRMLEGNDWKIISDDPEMKASEPGFVYDLKRDKLIAFGGSPERGQLQNTTWEWDGKAWKKFDGAGPEGRSGFAMIYDSKRSKTVIYGGGGTSFEQLFDDTWEFDGKTWTKMSVNNGPGARRAPGYTYDSKRGLLIIFGGTVNGKIQNDTWGWDGTEWKKLSDTGPTPRVMGHLAYDKKRDRVVMFGGRLGWPNDADDTWEWDGNVWQKKE